ncbi:hypothetical protein [Borrelia coriaceae]|uniref:hypothetical protein n=1 Tax=Borrelia coriaceae TaxID=144 RepID=UPI000487AAB8|nr:hypothetical protein [Borrelia coriaceae]
MEIEIEIGWFDKRNAKIARMHEFGNSKLPSRSHLYAVANEMGFKNYIDTNYIRNCFMENPKKGMQAIAKAFITYYTNYVVSNKVKPQIQAKTIAYKKRKGSSYPTSTLIDTANMLNSISYRINQ